MSGLDPTFVIGAIALSVAALSFGLAISGRVRAAWSVPGGILILAIAFVVVVAFFDGGGAGLAAVLILMFFFLPLLAGGVLGCLAGHVARAFGGRDRAR